MITSFSVLGGFYDKLILKMQMKRKHLNFLAIVGLRKMKTMVVLSGNYHVLIMTKKKMGLLRNLSLVRYLFRFDSVFLRRLPKVHHSFCSLFYESCTIPIHQNPAYKNLVDEILMFNPHFMGTYSA